MIQYTGITDRHFPDGFACPSGPYSESCRLSGFQHFSADKNELNAALFSATNEEKVTGCI